MPSSMCWPAGFGLPGQELRAFVVLRLLRRRVDADAVDPAAEVGRDGDVGRGRHDPRSDGRARGRARRACRRRPAGCSPLADPYVDVGRQLDRGRPDHRDRGSAVELLEALGAEPAQRAVGCESGPRVRLVGRELLREDVDLVGRRVGRVVQRIARERQTPALDRVREHDRRPRPIGVGLVERPLQLHEVVAAEVGQGARQVVVGDTRTPSEPGRRGPLPAPAR